MDIPFLFLEQMKQLLGEDYDSYYNSFQEKPFHGLRINTMKLTTEEFEQLSPFKIQKIPWISNGYYYEEDCKPAKHPYYYAGLYYLQEPSAMTPAQLLPIEPGERVLDLCAAPGGKSTELGSKLKGKGLLVANDISNSRAKSLLKNLELFGISNILVTSETPDQLLNYFPSYFDKILVDAPCSGEGMFRKDSSMIKSWLEHGPEYYAPIQREIASKAVQMLRPGGMLLYSTCTFSTLENEETIQYLLDTYPDLCVQPLPKENGFLDGVPQLMAGSPSLTGCLRLYPHKIKGEGHFMALLAKADSNQNFVKETRRSNAAVNLNNFKGIREFQELTCHLKLEEKALDVRNQMVYYLPKDLGNIKGLRFLRTGLLLGEIKKERFEPSQALAMVLGKDKFSNRLNLDVSDERVIRYLKGETLFLNSQESIAEDWCLVSVNGFPLGFSKYTRQMLKNKYYPGWRWQ